ncbi:hypothetical protein SAMN05660649_04482 [Desulfotomaculum arcticum]|uniref:Uncharacterized protein n=1 Tax=Desulfotruncus arcticus DSM 17038 TaxID=1121424 RepID=A0A1I2YM18_9FIRM|nr:hypothetical protein [Desulfotruncus arcticus]SFH26046.1 hypothetical protein SAMN05660649_04482 [Desulfotomaculum arcticum] [Desulfotruncus arcticus DSM 17038]
MAQNESDIAYNKALITALNKFQVARTEIMAEDVSSNLSRVSLKLFEITKTTAEVKPVFKLLYDEKPTPFLRGPFL